MDKNLIIKTRRKFLRNGGITLLSLALGLDNIYAKKNILQPPSYKETGILSLPDKHPEMKVLNDRPINAETPAYLLDESLTSGDRFFVRNNGIPPEKASIDTSKWTLSIEGESVVQSKTFTLNELKSRFKNYTYQLTLECGGNGRKAGDPNKTPISRGVPIKKAMEEESLIAWAMNGELLPYLNGYPLRLVFGGYPASCSGKWLNKIVVRNKVHDGAKMGAPSYRVPCKPVAPGTKVPNEEMCIIESMPVKSLITYPKTGATIQLAQELPIRGHAWAGDLEVKTMHYSIDFGATWQTCELTQPANRLAWQHFSAKIKFPFKGYYEATNDFTWLESQRIFE